MPDFLYSKRFWAAAASLIAVVLGDRLPIDAEQLTQIVLVVAAWIVGDSLRSTPTAIQSGRVRR